MNTHDTRQPEISDDSLDEDSCLSLAERLSVSMTRICGISVLVQWSYLQFRLICTHADGTPLPRRAQDGFDRLLSAEINRTPVMSL